MTAVLHKQHQVALPCVCASESSRNNQTLQQQASANTNGCGLTKSHLVPKHFKVCRRNAMHMHQPTVIRCLSACIHEQKMHLNSHNHIPSVGLSQSADVQTTFDTAASNITCTCTSCHACQSVNQAGAIRCKHQTEILVHVLHCHIPLCHPA